MSALTTYIASTDGFLTMGEYLNVLDQGSTEFTFPKTQNHLYFRNDGSSDAVIEVGNFNITVHPDGVWEHTFDFDSITVSAPRGAVSIWFTAKNYNTMPVTAAEYYTLENERAKGSTGMVLDGTNKTTSAAAINADIAGETGQHVSAYAITFEATGGTKHTWFNGVFPISVATDSVAGVVATSVPYMTVAAGDAAIHLVLTGTWVAGDVITVTITGGVQLGYTVADKELTDTLAA